MTQPNQTLLIQMSPDELKGLVIDCLHSVLSANIPSNAEPRKATAGKYVYGLNGLSKLLNCSHPTAQRIKDSGKIPFTQIGRKLIFEVDAVLSALQKSNSR